MKKTAATLLCFSLCLGFAVSASAETVKIGVFEPASGENSLGGTQETLGIEYANEMTPTVEINGIEYEVQLVPVDNESSVELADEKAEELLEEDVAVVLGSYGSGVSIAAADTFASAGVPVISISATSPEVTDGENYFRICYLDPFQGTAMADYAIETMGAETAYILTLDGDDYSVGLDFYFEDAFEDLGGEIVDENAFDEDEDDFYGFVEEAMDADADVIFAPIYIEDAQTLIDAASEAGCTIPILAGDTWDANTILNAAQGTDLEIYLTSFYQEGASDEFDANFKTWLNEDSDKLERNGGDDTIAAVSAMGHDAYNVALEAMKNAASVNPADIMEALWDTTYDGVSGTISFDDENGDAIRDTAYIKTVNTEDGTWVFVTEQSVQ